MSALWTCGTREIKRTFLLAVPAVISMAFDEINNMADKFFGTAMGTSVVTALGNSYTLVQSVLGILVVPITTIMFSQLSQYAALKQHDKLKSTVRQSLEIVALITLPIIVVAFVNSQDIIIGMFLPAGQIHLGKHTVYRADFLRFTFWEFLPLECAISLRAYFMRCSSTKSRCLSAFFP